MEIAWFIGLLIAAAGLSLISFASAGIGVFCSRMRARRAALVGGVCGALPGPLIAGVCAALALQSQERFLTHGPPIGPPIALMMGIAGLVAMFAGGAFGRWLGARRVIYNSSRSLCVNCSYDLNGLAGRRCPECGATF